MPDSTAPPRARDASARWGADSDAAADCASGAFRVLRDAGSDSGTGLLSSTAVARCLAVFFAATFRAEAFFAAVFLGAFFAVFLAATFLVGFKHNSC